MSLYCFYLRSSKYVWCAPSEPAPVGKVVLQVVASKVPSQRFCDSCLGYFSPTKPSWTPKPHRHTWTWWCGWRVFGAQPDEAYFGIFWATLNFSCGFLWQTCLQTTKNRGICFEAPGTFEVWHFKAHLLVLVLQIIADSCPEISYTSSRHQTSAVLPSPLTDPWTQTDRPAPISRWFSIAPMHGSCYCRQEPWIKILGNQNERHLWHTGLFSRETYLNMLKTTLRYYCTDLDETLTCNQSLSKKNCLLIGLMHKLGVSFRSCPTTWSIVNLACHISDISGSLLRTTFLAHPMATWPLCQRAWDTHWVRPVIPMVQDVEPPWCLTIQSQLAYVDALICTKSRWYVQCMKVYE